MTCFLGLDYGKRRVGIAVGDDRQYLAFALGAHVEGQDGSVISYLQDIIDERGVGIIVMGLPLTADGREGEMTMAVRAFAALLGERLKLPVELWDERFSSVEADRWLALRKQTAKADRDAVAAAIILQSFLDHRRADAGQDREGE